jgi:hypothetical protein
VTAERYRHKPTKILLNHHELVSREKPPSLDRVDLAADPRTAARKFRRSASGGRGRESTARPGGTRRRHPADAKSPED